MAQFLPKIGYNAVVSYSSDGGSTYTAITQTINIKTPESDIAKVKATTLTSPNYFVQNIPGMISSSDLEFSCIYFPDQWSSLNTLAMARTNLTWKVTGVHGAAETFVFGGFISKLSAPEFEDEKLTTYKIDVCRTTVITFAEASSSSSDLGN